MDEILRMYEREGNPIPLDILVRAVETYGYLIETNYPQEDELDGE